MGADCEASPAPRGGGAIKAIKSTTPGCQRILKLVVKYILCLAYAGYQAGEARIIWQRLRCYVRSVNVSVA